MFSLAEHVLQHHATASNQVMRNTHVYAFFTAWSRGKSCLKFSNALPFVNVSLSNACIDSSERLRSGSQSSRSMNAHHAPATRASMEVAPAKTLAMFACPCAVYACFHIPFDSVHVRCTLGGSWSVPPWPCIVDRK